MKTNLLNVSHETKKKIICFVKYAYYNNSYLIYDYEVIQHNENDEDLNKIDDFFWNIFNFKDILKINKNNFSFNFRISNLIKTKKEIEITIEFLF